MKKTLYITALALMVHSSLFGGDFNLFDIPNADHKVKPEMIEKSLEAKGFYISANTEMNGPFVKQFQQSDFEVFNLLTVFHKEHASTLVKAHPDAGIFVPMGVGIYQRKGENTLHVAVLTDDAQKKIAGFDAPEFALIEKEVVQTISALAPAGPAIRTDWK